MKRTLVLLLLLLLTAVAPANAQNNATALDGMIVELWPDYDRPAMLVLLTGTLPAATTLPATVSLPLPAGAEVHAVARFAEANVLVSDVDWSVANGEITLTTPGRAFRVEYYDPYAREGAQTTYVFEWQSDLAIGDVSAIVQQPLAARDFVVVPAPTSSDANRGDGLNYHQIAGRPVAANEPFTIEVSYTVDAPVLSAPSAAVTATATPVAEAGVLGGLSPWWLLAIPVGLLLLAGAWYLGRQTGSGRARKPRPTRVTTTRPGKAKDNAPTTQGAAGFCHHCGQPAQSGDVFCRKCGTRLKV